jgi:Flp pilus assembly pilin Flp
MGYYASNVGSLANRARIAMLGRARLLLREDGQSFVEYALVMVVVAVTLAAGLLVTPLGTAVNGAIDAVANAVSGKSG